MTGLRWAPYRVGDMAEQHIRGGVAYALDRGLLDDLGRARACVAAAGVFDGMHIGHRSLVGAAADEAHDAGVKCVVITFDPDPVEVVGGGAAACYRLLPTAHRIRAILDAGADVVVAYSFSREFAAVSADAFMRSWLSDVVRPVSMHVGSNFRFGSGGAGDPRLLADLGREMGFSVHEHDLVLCGDQSVSSSRIRAKLAAGDLDDANALLDRCHYVCGRVVHGRGEGTSFGFPTANVVMDQRDCVPAQGVYAGYVVRESRAWPAAINVGAPPTFSQERQSFLEANLLGFSGNLYDAEVCVSFVSWLRSSRTFASVDELAEVVLGNIDWVRTHLGEGELGVFA